MRVFPDITLTSPDLSMWLWIIIPFSLAGLFLFAEFVIERQTEKRRGAPVVGVGFVLMGIALFVGMMGVTLVPDAIHTIETQKVVAALEGIGFQDVRLSLDQNSFGGYYDGELVRGVFIEDPSHENVYNVYETPPPSRD